MKSNIGIDIDDCITQTAQLFCAVFRKLYKQPLNVKQLSSANVKFEGQGLVSSDQVRGIKSFYAQNRVFREIRPYPDAVETVKLLGKKFNVYLITSRDDYQSKLLKEDTEYWFKSRGITNFNLIFSKDKAGLAKKFELIFFVEDSVKYAKLILTAKTKTKVILLEKPWNKNKLIDRQVVKVKNWQDLKSKLNLF